MASLKKTFSTRNMPPDVERFSRKGVEYARWKDREGKMQTGRVNAAGRLITESSTWYAKYRGADGVVRVEPTGCRDKTAAASRLAALVQEQEKIKGGIITEEEAVVSKSMGADLSATIADYIAHMKALGRSKAHIYSVNMYLTRGVKELGWKTIRSLSASGLSTWLDVQAITPKIKDKPESVMGAKTHNAILTAWGGFANWLKKRRRIMYNPFSDLSKRNESAHRKHVRRMLSDDELLRLFAAAEHRPLQDALKGNRGRREKMVKTEADLTDATKDRLGWLGRVRSMTYRTAASTGLRLGELRAIRLGDVMLDDELPHMLLRAGDEKNRKGSIIPVPGMLLPLLQNYTQERLRRLAGRRAALPGAFAMERLFPIPDKMCDVIADDYRAAGIEIVDASGRCVDFHVLRSVFATRLARANTPVHIAQKLMRHSDPKLTLNIYTHTRLEDMVGAVNGLPDFQPAVAKRPRVMNEVGSAAPTVAPTVAPDADFLGQREAIPVILELDTHCSTEEGKECVLSADSAGFQNMAEKKDGVPGGTRTPNLLVRSQALYPIELQVHIMNCVGCAC